MDYKDIAYKRQSCRAFDKTRSLEDEKIASILEMARLAPSACNGQPYHLTVCRGNSADAVSKCVTGMGMNGFAKDAPVLLVISEEDYVASAALGARLKGNDYRSIDIGILCAYITSAACELGVESCILGWFDDKKIREICGLSHPVRLVICLGYAKDGYSLREKKRIDIKKLVTEIE